MFNIICYKRNANEKCNEISLYTSSNWIKKLATSPNAGEDVEKIDHQLSCLWDWKIIQHARKVC